MNKILIIGANGQLGTALQNKFPKALTADVNTLDITNEKSVNAYPWKNVDIIINAAAFTNVDGAETPQGRISAWQVNATAVANLAKIATTHNITLVHISSDYVFDGSKKNYNEAASFSPLSVYGASKAAGDLSASVAPKHYIIRTSWVIGNGNNFVRTIQCRWVNSGEHRRVRFRERQSHRPICSRKARLRVFLRLRWRFRVACFMLCIL